MRLKRVLMTIGQFILAVIVTVFILYKLALVFDWVPPDFSPVGMVDSELQSFKEQLREASTDNDLQGKLSKIAYVIIVRTENYFAIHSSREAEQDRLAQKCQESSLMRFFMFGDGKSPESANCMQQNLKIENAIKDFNAAPTTPGSAVPATQSTQPKVTIINSSETRSTPRSTNPTNSNLSAPIKSNTYTDSKTTTNTTTTAPTTLHGSQLTPNQPYKQ